jgi:2-haloacid dehalogenase
MIDSLVDRGHTPYRQIGHRAVSQVLDRAEIKHSQAEVEWLVSRIEELKPFPDVIEALHRLRQRYKLVILSNGDRDMLQAAKPHIGFDFDLTISVQESGAFKPDKRTYAKAEEIICRHYSQIEHSSILFVANHAFDCIGAKAWGMRTVFIDRRRRPFGQTPHQPDLIVKDFAELAEVMTTD